ncbi:hypothetical protein NKJ35_28945 [Mesorhizobium sp. M0136]|uniref:hypothetical protein n=1 Tax=Mesorhizobium sp. M0136 TaxID=2956890 RepID=UPI003335D90A
MKKRIVAAGMLIAVLTGSTAFADTYGNGYTKSNSTYVQPYVRSSPDGTGNNYSMRAI